MDKTDVPQLHLFLIRRHGDELLLRVVAERDAEDYALAFAANPKDDAGFVAVAADARIVAARLEAALGADPAAVARAQASGFVGLYLHGARSCQYEMLRLLARVPVSAHRLRRSPSGVMGLLWPVRALALPVEPAGVAELEAWSLPPGASRGFGDLVGGHTAYGDSQESGRGGDSDES